MSLCEEALRYLGYKGQDIDEEFFLQIEKNIQLLEKSIKPSFLYRVFDIKTEDDVYIEGTKLKLIGEDVKKHLNGASKCAVMASTLGVESERIIRNLSKTSMSDVVIFDALCTAKIEEVADECESKIKDFAKQNGYYTNFRFSPGYGDFPLEVQRDIIGILECEKKMGLTVTESFLLLPQKSVTAIIGLFESIPENMKKSCENCNLKDKCIYKKTGKICERRD